MSIPTANFGLVTVNALYTSGDTSITLVSGHGSRLPNTFPYPMTWWNSTDYAHPADDPNKEIVSVTNRSTDTLTISRGQEGTSPSNKNTSSKVYRMSLGITKSMWSTLQTPTQFVQGLQLQTHRDSDLAPSQVELVDVDSIIMNDGVELRNDNGEWSGLTADITISGAGGLDTGTETVSTWYEIYAIAQEDSTRALLLHQSKIWAVNTNYISGEDASQGIRSAVDNSTVKVAQGFKVGQSGKIPYIEVKLIKVGTPTGKIWFTVETDSSGTPSGTAVATSHAYDVSRLSTTATTIRIPMKSSQTISAIPTQYHLVAQGTWTISSTNYVAWRMDGSSATYGNGAKSLFDSDTSTWTTDTDDDLIFGIALETGNTPVTMPAGYTKQCFLGWVYNDGAGNFIPFLQVGRSRRVSRMTQPTCRVWSTSGSAELIDLAGVLPPRKILRVTFSFTGTGSSSGVIAMGDLSATDITSAGDTVGTQRVINASGTTTRPTEFGDALVQSRGIMAMGTFMGYLWVVGFEW